MPTFSRNLCYNCIHWIKCEGECGVGNYIEETDENGNPMFVTSCCSYDDSIPTPDDEEEV